VLVNIVRGRFSVRDADANDVAPFKGCGCNPGPATGKDSLDNCPDVTPWFRRFYT
jgi:hypothetical protein